MHRVTENFMQFHFDTPYSFISPPQFEQNFPHSVGSGSWLQPTSIGDSYLNVSPHEDFQLVP